MASHPEIQVVGAPRGFLERPEFGPRIPGPGGRPVWLPLDPAFAPRILLAPGEGTRDRTGEEDGAAGRMDGSRAEATAGGEGRDRTAAATAVAERAGVALPGTPLVEPIPGRALAGLFRDVLARHRIEPGRRAKENLELLEAGAARRVITGQQPGFLGGPLYTAYKAATAAGAASHLESVTGIRHVPVFWVASEDHDLDEARTAALPGPGGSTAEFRFPGPSDRRPLSAIPVEGDGLEVLDAAIGGLEGHLSSDAARALADLYRGRTFAGGFTALIARLFEGSGLLPIEPDVLRPFARPIFRKAIVEAGALRERIEAGIGRASCRERVS